MLPVLQHYILKDIVTGVPYTQYIMPGFEKILQNIRAIKEKWFEEIEQTSERESDMARMLKL